MPSKTSAMRALRVAAILTAALALPALAHAHSSGSSGPSEMLRQGQRTLSIVTAITFGNQFRDNELVDYASRHIHAHSVGHIVTVTPTLGYGVSDDLTLSLSVPQVYRGNMRAGNHSHSGGLTTNTVDNHGNAGGLGDASIQAQFRLLRGHDTQASAVFGLKIPTGNKSQRSRTGETLEAEFQPGSGSWDPTIGFTAARRFKSVTVSGELVFTKTSTGTQRTNLGDRASAAVSVAHTHGAWDYSLKLEGEWEDRKKVASTVERNSGGAEIFLGPGIAYTSHAGWSAHAEFGMPVYSHMRQGHAGTAFKSSFGISKGF